MLTGKRFRLKSPALALNRNDKTGLTLSAGSVVHVIDGPQPDKPVIRIVCENKWLVMLEYELRTRGEEIL